MLIKVTSGHYDAYFNDGQPIIDGIDFFDNIDKAKGYVERQLEGKDWVANHPGMTLDTYVYDKQYFSGVSFQLKSFKYIKLEMI